MSAPIDMPLSRTDLLAATPEHLLACVLGAWGGTEADVVGFGIDSAVADLELLCELSQDRQRGENQAICNIQTRLRVLAELHRRQLRDQRAAVGIKAGSVLVGTAEIRKALDGLMAPKTFKSKPAESRADAHATVLYDHVRRIEKIASELGGTTE